jgi:hypothetical protein
MDTDSSWASSRLEVGLTPSIQSSISGEVQEPFYPCPSVFIRVVNSMVLAENAK